MRAASATARARDVRAAAELARYHTRAAALAPPDLLAAAYEVGTLRFPPVTAFVDTSILVRHLTGDPPAMAERATRYLSGAENLLLADLVVAETVYVLESFYEALRHDVARAIRSLLGFRPVRCVDAPLLRRAVEVYETDRLDFTRAYLVACAETTGVGRVASFDRAIDRVPSVARVEPG